MAHFGERQPALSAESSAMNRGNILLGDLIVVWNV